MIYPKFLQNNNLIGITALSGGCNDALLEINKAIDNLKDNGFQVIISNNVYSDTFVSSSKEQRIKELNTLLEKPLSMLLIARGGELLYEIIDSIPYQKITHKNIWVMGYSDPTSLLYILTTKYDLATIYGFNAKSFSDMQLAEYQMNCIEIIKGNLKKQISFDNQSMSLHGDFSSSGIIIGGCLDVLKDVIGTKYDDTLNFINKYKDKKIIWYFDIYDMDSISVYRTLLQFKAANWFLYSDTFLIGKVFLKGNENLMSYQEAFAKALFKNVVFNTNIGHVKPCFTIINGSYINISYKNSQLVLEYK